MVHLSLIWLFWYVLPICRMLLSEKNMCFTTGKEEGGQAIVRYPKSSLACKEEKSRNIGQKADTQNDF